MFFSTERSVVESSAALTEAELSCKTIYSGFSKRLLTRFTIGPRSRNERNDTSMARLVKRIQFILLLQGCFNLQYCTKAYANPANIQSTINSGADSKMTRCIRS